MTLMRKERVYPVNQAGDLKNLLPFNPNAVREQWLAGSNENSYLPAHYCSIFKFLYFLGFVWLKFFLFEDDGAQVDLSGHTFRLG